MNQTTKPARPPYRFRRGRRDRGVLLAIVLLLLAVVIAIAASMDERLRVARIVSPHAPLLLVANDLARGWPDEGYIHIDWGPEFHAQFSDHYPDAPPPTLVANIGWLGVQQLLTYGGSGYFPQRLVRHYIKDGLLWHVPDSPQFKLPAYMVFPRDSESDSATLKQALDGLRELAQAEQS